MNLELAQIPRVIVLCATVDNDDQFPLYERSASSREAQTTSFPQTLSVDTQCSQTKGSLLRLDGQPKGVTSSWQIFDFAEDPVILIVLKRARLSSHLVVDDAIPVRVRNSCCINGNIIRASDASSVSYTLSKLDGMHLFRVRYARAFERE